MAAEKKLFVLVLFAFFGLNLNLGISPAADVASIRQVQAKPVLEEGDFRVIDSFVADAVKELVEAKDYTNISELRRDILNYSSSKTDSAQAQYHKQFFKSAHQYLGQAFEAADKGSSEKRFKIFINLLIVIDGLGDVGLADLAVQRLDDKSSVVRYWAVRCVTSKKMIEQLNEEGADNEVLRSSIFEGLEKIAGEDEGWTMAGIARFCTDINDVKGAELLIKMADMRIKKYADWSVKDELLDGIILKAIGSRLSKGRGGNSAALGMRFCQLYSFVIQRYVKGADLSDRSKEQLITVMVDVEDESIGNLLGRQKKIKNAIEKRDMEALMGEHNTLLGSSVKIGRLPLKLDFSYIEQNGVEGTAPLVLQDRKSG